MLELSAFDLVMIILGFLFFAVWLFFFIKGLKFSGFFNSLEEKEYPFKEIYIVGYAILETFHYNYKTKYDRKLRQELEVLYDKKYTDYYLRVVHSQQISLAFTVFVFSFALYGIANDFMAFIVGCIFAVVIYYYYRTETNNKIKKRSDEMMHDFSEVVSKLALLTNAGMILREAWEEIAYAGNTTIYSEMQKSVIEMNNGISEVDAIYNFGVRCILPDIKKFTSTIIQGLVKGNSELSTMLQNQSKEVWQQKKQIVRREGEKAASKLLIPILIMFIGILIMIVVPIFTNIGA